MVQRFFKGFGFVFRGQKLLREIPGAKVLVLMPFLIGMTLLGAGVYFGSPLIGSFVAFAIGNLFEAGTTTFSIFYYVALVLFWSVSIVLFFYFIYLATKLISSPFCGFLAEKAMVHLKAIPDLPFSLSRTVRFSLRMLWVSLLRSLVLLAVGLFLLVLSFAPGLNLVAGFAAFVILAFDSMDYAFEAGGFGLRARLQYFGKFLPEFCGMGAFLGLTVFVPGLILLVMPLAVLGSSEFLALSMLSSKGAGDVGHDSREHSQ